MAITRVVPALIQVANNVTSTTIGNTTSIPSLTFDASGVIISASNTTVTVANTNITGNITSSQIVPDPVFNGNTTVTNIIVGAGSNTAPSISSIGIANTGIFFPSANNIGFATNGITRGTWTTDGLCFGSDTAAANALDDYEEGTWTPDFIGSTTAGTVSYSTNSATYTKIGRFVYCQFYIVFSSTHTGTGALVVNGFPFTVASGYGAGGQVSGYKGNWGGNGPDFAQMENGTTYGYIRYDNNTTIGDIPPNTSISSGTYFMMSFWYHSAT